MTIETTSPVVASGSNVGGPEFISSHQVKTLFGLSKTHAYNLRAEGKIRSVCLRKRGAVRGRRLWDVESIRAYLRANIEGGAE